MVPRCRGRVLEGSEGWSDKGVEALFSRSSTAGFTLPLAEMALRSDLGGESCIAEGSAMHVSALSRIGRSKLVLNSWAAP